MGPLDASRPWEDRDVVGQYRFLQRVWRNVIDEETGARRTDVAAADRETIRLLHVTIDGVRRDMDALRFNTAIAKLIELNNHLTRIGGCPDDAAEALVLMLAPLAPHAAEDMWSRLGHASSLALEPFPMADTALLATDRVELPVQVDGKVRARVTVDATADAAAIEAAALSEPRIAELLDGQAPRKVIVVPGRMVSIVR